MKRCPECRRDYYDDTLLYCLDDGNALLEGPASGRGARSETKTEILDTVEIDKEQTSLSPESIAGSRKNRRFGFIVGTLILLFAVVGFGYWFFVYHAANTNKAESVIANTPKTISRFYWQMTEAEQLIFIRERAQQVKTLIGDEPTEFDEEALRAIKVEIDAHVAEKDSLSQKPFEEGLRVIFGRASQYVPIIIRGYEARQVPPALGIYQAMIESEFHDCQTSNLGAGGMFQLVPKTAQKYGLMPKDYCNVKKEADAAARYMSDLSSDFGDGKSSGTLGLLSFAIGETKVRGYLRQLRRRGITEQTFWVILQYRQDLQPPLPDDGARYIPRFFAAAIIGETPEHFELSTPPLSTLRKKDN